MRFKFCLFLVLLLILISGCSTNIISNNNSSLNDSKQDFDLIQIRYHGMTCQIEPWQKWLDESDIRFIRAPLEEEIIVMYYSSVYELDITEVKKIQFDGAFCEACKVCPKGYGFEAKVQKIDLKYFLDENWEILR